MLLGACSAPPAVEVIAADGVLCDLTRRLTAADLRVECLLEPNDDPHQVQLSPSQSRAVRQARLVLINGYGLTPALEHLPAGAAVAVAERAVPDSPALEHGHDGRDPHVWHDPAQAAAMVAVLSRELQRLRPAAATPIARRAAAMADSLNALDRWNRSQFASLPAQPGRRTLAMGHRALASLSRAYGLQELAVVDAHSASESLRPQALTAAVMRLRQDQVPALFSETWPPSRALQRISALSGVPVAPQVLRVDGLAPGDGTASTPGDLMTTLTANTCLIVDQLGGRCDRAGQRELISRWQAIR
ncbi:MAG: metal ABC transporter substrate-binding protein [Vulcanococcus sp.]